jgi:hypothetical protein
MPIITTHSVGRLMETRFVAPVVSADFEQLARDRREIARRVTGQRVVCADLRGTGVLSPELADMLLSNKRGVEDPLRNALLLAPDRATLALQIERIIREGKNPARRVFRDRDALVAWLDEVLTPPERARVREFLDGK